MVNMPNDIAKKVVYRSPGYTLSDDDKKPLNSIDSDSIVKELKKIFHREKRYSVARNRAFKAALVVDSLDKVDFLLDIFDKAHVDWKTAICDELSSFHDPRAIAALSDILLTAKNPNVRYAATEALSVIGDATAIPALEYAAQHDQGRDFEGLPVAEEARSALQSIRARLPAVNAATAPQ